jgi:hypothetical protein
MSGGRHKLSRYRFRPTSVWETPGENQPRQRPPRGASTQRERQRRQGEPKRVKEDGDGEVSEKSLEIRHFQVITCPEEPE